MMKRILFLTTLIVAALALTACGGDKKKAGESATEKVDEMASQAQESMDGIELPSESVTRAVSDTWVVPDTDEVYVLQADGTGNRDGDPFTFECGFDDENNITLKITMDDGSAENLYAISTDSTGYGIDLAALDGGEDLKFLPEDLEFLSTDDGRISGLTGTWTDESGNEYEFDKDGSMAIRSADSETSGTFSAVSDAKGGLFFRIVVEGGSLEYGFELSEDGTEMKLASPGTDVIHTWTKK